MDDQQLLEEAHGHDGDGVLLADKLAVHEVTARGEASADFRTVDAQLTRYVLRLGDEEVELASVVGVEQISAGVLVHSYLLPPPSCCNSRPSRAHSAVCVSHVDEERQLEWYRMLLVVLREAEPDTPLEQLAPRRFLVLINPASGSGNARSMWKDEFAPVFEHAGVQVRERVTEHQGHAVEIARELDLNVVDAIITVSGDGLLTEVLDGFMQRDDWSDAVKTLLFPLPAGSGNGACMSLLDHSGEPFSSTNAAFLAVKGKPTPADLMSFVQAGEPVRYGFLSVSWGFIANADLESEKWRCCGGERFTFTAIQLLLCGIRHYNSRISVLPAGFEPEAAHAHVPPINEDIVAAALEEVAAVRQRRAEDADAPPFYGGEDEVDQWVEDEDERSSSLWGLTMPWGSTQDHAAPLAKINDGFMDLGQTYDVTFCSMAPMLLGLEDGSQIENDKWRYRKVKALRWSPGEGRVGELSWDGERVPQKPFELRVHRGVLNFASTNPNG